MIKVMYEDDEDDQAIDRAKGHDKVGVLGAAGGGEGQLCLRQFGQEYLVEARDSIHKTFVLRAFEGVSCSLVTVRDGHRDHLGDQVERNVV